MVTLGEFSLSLMVPYTSAALPKADGARGPGLGLGLGGPRRLLGTKGPRRSEMYLFFQHN